MFARRRSLKWSLSLALLLLAGLVSWLPAQQQAPRKLAFLVGVSKYDKDGLKNLDFAERDVTELKKELEKAGFRVQMLLGSAEGDERATKANRERLLGVQMAGDRPVLGDWLLQMAGLKKGDVALLVFTGHGRQRQVQRNGRFVEDAFFCPVDANKNNPATMLSIGTLMKDIGEHSGSSQNLVVMDACRDNPDRGARNIDGSTMQALPSKISVLFGSSSGKESFESKALRHGLLSHALLEGLRGKAAQDNEVSWGLLVSYAQRRVPQEARKIDQEQKPNIIMNLTDDPILVALKSLSQPREITNSVGMKLVRIPAGKFKMGSPESEKGREKNEELHDVEISRPFYLGQFEVTRGQFRRFVEDEGYQTEAEKDGQGGYGVNDGRLDGGRRPEYTWKNTGFTQTDERSVVNVTWNDAQAFCRWLTRKEGKTYRLPTEAEWEYSCRAGTRTAYYSGDDPETLADVGNVADGTLKKKFPDWTGIRAEDGYIFTAPVGKFRPNAFGLYDMHGNVWEWCQDWYDNDYYKNSPAQDPLGPSAGSDRVMRGDGWSLHGWPARAALRPREPPSNRYDDLGFRVARIPSGE